jgi:catechol 2,3-dioxygenase-like lactoylglutathione lyase family enzyme
MRVGTGGRVRTVKTRDHPKHNDSFRGLTMSNVVLSSGGTTQSLLPSERGRKQPPKEKEYRIMDMKLEVVVLPVSDVERAKRFYETLGFRLDLDIAPNENYRAVHLTPPGSQASILFGKGVTSAKPGSIDRLLLAVYDIDAARQELLSKGVDVSEVFHDSGGSVGGGFIAGTQARAAGPDPQHRSYASYASFNDPDGNVWLLQELKERLPGRV